MDSFTFAARYPGGKYSSVVRCDIKISDAQAKIEVSPKPPISENFSSAKKRNREIVIRNKGNLLYNRTIQMFSPWRLISPSDGKIVLAPGNQTTDPRWHFQPDRGRVPPATTWPSVAETGAPASSAGKRLFPSPSPSRNGSCNTIPQEERREADVIVNNNTERPVEVFLTDQFTAPDLLPRTIRSSFPGRENKVKVHLAKDDVAAFDGGLELKLKNGYSEMVNVFCQTQPAELKIEIPNQLGQDVINFRQGDGRPQHGTGNHVEKPGR